MNRPKRSKIDTPTARAGLPVAGKPVYKSLETGVFIGYRRGKVERRWVARVYDPATQAYTVEPIGVADDADAPAGVETMSYAQARDAVLALAARKRGRAAAQTIATVRAVIEAYIAMRDARELARTGRPVKSHAHRLKACVLDDPSLAEMPVLDLTEKQLADWRAGLAGRESNKRRIASDLRAGLLRTEKLTGAVRDTIKAGLRIPDDSAEADDGEPEARESQILGDDEVRRLLAAARDADEDGDLHDMLLLLAATGARFSQLRRLRVGDVQASLGRIMVPGSFKGKRRATAKISYPVPVGQDVIAAIMPAMKGRKTSEPLLQRWRHKQVGFDRKTGRVVWERESRGPWNVAAELTRPFAVVAKAAGLPHVIPYSFRHSSIVRGIRMGLPIRLVAAGHDTSVAMIERHYSRWIVEGLEELTRKAIVPLVGEASGNVVPLHSGSVA